MRRLRRRLTAAQLQEGLNFISYKASLARTPWERELLLHDARNQVARSFAPVYELPWHQVESMLQRPNGGGELLALMIESEHVTGTMDLTDEGFQDRPDPGYNEWGQGDLGSAHVADWAERAESGNSSPYEMRREQRTRELARESASLHAEIERLGQVSDPGEFERPKTHRELAAQGYWARSSDFYQARARQRADRIEREREQLEPQLAQISGEDVVAELDSQSYHEAASQNELGGWD